MNMETDFRALLLADASLKALVGERVFFSAQPQDERRPRLLIRLHHYQHRTLTGPTDDTTTRASIDALAPTYSQAAEIAEAVQNALDVHFLTQGKTLFTLITADDIDDIPQQPQASRETATFGRNLPATVYWRRAV